MALFTRTQSPPKFTDYKKYLSFLRIDFRQSCAYCERSELAVGGEESFEIDHFRPTAVSSADFETDYRNLYYSCHKCNQFKGGTWPSDARIVDGFRFADPCQEDMYAEHLLEDEQTGKLLPLSNCGKYTRDHIKLNRPALLKWRQNRRAAMKDMRIFQDMIIGCQVLLEAEDRPELQKDLVSRIETTRSALALLRQIYSLEASEAFPS